MAINPAKDRKTGEIIPDVWIIDYRPEGRKGPRLRQRFEGTEAEARMLELDLRRAYRAAGPTSVNPRIAEVIPDWLDHYGNERSENTRRDVKYCLTRLIPYFGNMLFTCLTPQVIETYKKQRLDDGVSKRTINKELSYFSGLCSWAAENNYCSPLPFKIRKFPAKQAAAKKPRPPSVDETQALINAIEPKYRGILLAMYDAGLRRTEALQLRVENVMLKQRLLYITGKGDKERIVPILTDRLFEELQAAVKKRRIGYLWTNPANKNKPYHGIRKALMRAAKTAGIEQRVYHHLLRHSFGTHATIAGVGLRALQDMMGHSTTNVTELYSQLAAENIAREGGKFAALTEKSTKPESTEDGKTAETG